MYYSDDLPQFPSIFERYIVIILKTSLCLLLKSSLFAYYCNEYVAHLYLQIIFLKSLLSHIMGINI